jgi:hypothetical protein
MHWRDLREDPRNDVFLCVPHSLRPCCTSQGKATYESFISILSLMLNHETQVDPYISICCGTYIYHLYVVGHIYIRGRGVYANFIL